MNEDTRSWFANSFEESWFDEIWQFRLAVLSNFLLAGLALYL